MGRDNKAGFQPIIAVVDDDPAVRNSLKFALEIDGFRVRDFADAGVFLQAGNFSAFSCLVIDQKMPGMAGLDLIACLRDRRVSTPAILVTTHPSAALIAHAARSETPIVEKPLLGNALIERIHAACQAAPSPL